MFVNVIKVGINLYLSYMKEFIRNILNEEIHDQRKRMIKKVWDSQKETTLIPKINWTRLKKMRLWDPQEFGSEYEILGLYNDYLNLNEEERYERFDIEFTGQELDETFLIKNGFQTNDKFKFNITGVDILMLKYILVIYMTLKYFQRWRMVMLHHMKNGRMARIIRNGIAGLEDH